MNLTDIDAALSYAADPGREGSIDLPAEKRERDFAPYRAMTSAHRRITIEPDKRDGNAKGRLSLFKRTR